VYDVEKMRTILLMNAEFNMNNKKLGGEMMANAERHGEIAREQYGSHTHHQCILAALNKRLTMDCDRHAVRGPCAPTMPNIVLTKLYTILRRLSCVVWGLW
jgi:hypothetical protein